MHAWSGGWQGSKEIRSEGEPGTRDDGRRRSRTRQSAARTSRSGRFSRLAAQTSRSVSIVSFQEHSSRTVSHLKRRYMFRSARDCCAANRKNRTVLGRAKTVPSSPDDDDPTSCRHALTAGDHEPSRTVHLEAAFALARQTILRRPIQDELAEHGLRRNLVEIPEQEMELRITTGVIGKGQIFALNFADDMSAER